MLPHRPSNPSPLNNGIKLTNATLWCVCYNGSWRCVLYSFRKMRQSRYFLVLNCLTITYFRRVSVPKYAQYLILSRRSSCRNKFDSLKKINIFMSVLIVFIRINSLQLLISVVHMFPGMIGFYQNHWYIRDLHS